MKVSSDTIINKEDKMTNLQLEQGSSIDLRQYWRVLTRNKLWYYINNIIFNTNW